ncbi:hypothetical protein JKP88DRAFT_325911 [Tribonema minus]|uniref:Uncharacterized protein n=1 Tax=Tribonema minus TaxID=303371 RepID=A0A836CBP9_9STRA|nr:hypothetical protein JKP88DRAFT_325911 [Tribonema minus]
MVGQHSRTRSKNAPTLQQPPPVAQVFNLMASLSLLPKAAWDLNKQLRRDIRPVVTLRVEKETSRALLRSVLGSKSTRHLIGEGGLPGVHGLPDTIREITLEGVQSRLLLGALPRDLEALTLNAAARANRSCLAACLNELPHSVRRLSFSCWSWDDYFSMADVKFPPGLEALELRNISEVTALPASLTSIKLSACRLTPALQLPASLTSVYLSSMEFTATAAPVDQVRCIPALPQQLQKLELLLLEPWLRVAPLAPTLAHLYVDYAPHQWAGAANALRIQPLAPLPHTLKTLVVAADFSRYAGAHPGSPAATPGGAGPAAMHLFRHPSGAAAPSTHGSAPGDNFTQALGPLPLSLTELQFIPRRNDYWPTCRFNSPLGPLPAQLRVLNLRECSHFNFPLGALPPTLQELRLGEAFDQPLLSLPPTLEVLLLGYHFSQPLPHQLPAALRDFQMGHDFNAPIELPGTLQRLVIGDTYTHQLHVPRGLKMLRISQSYIHPVPPLPLAHVCCPQWYPHAVECRSMEYGL